MSDESRDANLRLHELLAGRDLDDLSPDERHELESLLAESGEAPRSGAVLGDLLVVLDGVQDGQREEMPTALRDRLARQGKAMLAAETPVPGGRGASAPSPSAGRIGPAAGTALAIAAVLALAGAGVTIWALGSRNKTNLEAEQLASQVQQSEAESQRLATALEQARRQVEENARMLSDAQEHVRTLEASYESELAEAEARRLVLAQRLATATADLDAAELKIARFEAPQDPAELAANRQKLLEVPGSIRLGWSPFDVAGLPPTEQQGEVTGDVVWNDDLQTGYLRFVGLDPNDPNIEQYQVWVIDERGMEQKVSGGVFNVTADGEIIVPIEPGIDVGRVALFAITVENPGGTWVPDLQRRVVVAPREEEG